MQSIGQSYYDGSMDTEAQPGSFDNSFIQQPAKKVVDHSQFQFQNSLMEKQTAVGEISTIRKQ